MNAHSSAISLSFSFSLLHHPTFTEIQQKTRRVGVQNDSRRKAASVLLFEDSISDKLCESVTIYYYYYAHLGRTAAIFEKDSYKRGFAKCSFFSYPQRP